MSIRFIFVVVAMNIKISHNFIHIHGFHFFSLFLFFQLDSADEQTAAIRRELDGRIQKCAEMEKVSAIGGCH